MAEMNAGLDLTFVGAVFNCLLAHRRCSGCRCVPQDK